MPKVGLKIYTLVDSTLSEQMSHVVELVLDISPARRLLEVLANLISAREFLNNTNFSQINHAQWFLRPFGLRSNCKLRASGKPASGKTISFRSTHTRQHSSALSNYQCTPFCTQKCLNLEEKNELAMTCHWFICLEYTSKSYAHCFLTESAKSPHSGVSCLPPSSLSLNVIISCPSSEPATCTRWGSSKVSLLYPRLPDSLLES